MKEIKYEVTAEFDLDSRSFVGKVKSDDDSFTDESGDFNRNVFDSVRKAFDSISASSTKKIRELISSEDYDEAFLAVKESLGGSDFLKEDYYFALKELSNHLSDDQLKEISIYLVAFSSKFGLINELEVDIETCLRLKDHGMSELEEMSLYIEKSRVLYEKGAFNASYAVLQEILRKTKNNMILGCAFRNLARLTTQKEDFELYSNKAIDNFIVSGNTKEAISVIFSLIERVEGKLDTAALELIEQAIELQSSGSYIGKGRLATLLQRKGSILINLNRYHDAKEPILEACNLRRGLLGEEAELHASLVKAEVVLRLNDENDYADEIKEEYQELGKLITDDDFILTSKVMESLDSGTIDSFDGDSILNDEKVSPYIKFGCLMVKYLNGGYEFSNNIELLDKALAFAVDSKDYKLKAIALKEMAKQYALKDYVSTAIEKLYECIGIDSSDMEAFQNIIYFLIEDKRLAEACDLLKSKIDLVGYLPNLTFIYAKTLFENEKYLEAFKIFKIVVSQGDVVVIENGKTINEYIMECMDNLGEGNSDGVVALCENKADVTLRTISSALDDFSASISGLSRMHYWVKDDTKGYKWIPNPETVAKHHLLQFLSARFGSDLELVQEDRAGAGFIDLYLIAKNGIKFVVELKMCGSGYSSTYALSGESQIIHYLTNKDTNVGFLIVFDSRSRDFSKKLVEFKAYGHFSIYTKIIDVRNVIEK